ncbi:MAG: hypothetical protein KAJ60_04705 [Desulfobulbaceae bacterium]|nr:hypothetical protein [Desulfobulbaceae bacterium]MCK5340351.1 hypothetical protein [Desulfobulbaceae bacterium]
MLDKNKCTLYSGGLRGAECAFGEIAEKFGIKEVTLSFEGMSPEREAGLQILSTEELKRGDISMELVSKMMHRTYYETDKIRKVLQVIFHMVNNGHQVFAVGSIQQDNTVKGGTGWAVELAKVFNRPVSVYDQQAGQWFSWQNNSWQKDTPKIEYDTFVGSGTRNLTDAGRAAIENLFKASFSA